MVESLGEEVGRSQVRQVALALGFTPSEVTSIEQVVGGGESASMMLLHLLLVWQEQKQAGREEARGKLAAALNEGGMSDTAAKLDQRCECVCVFITCYDDFLGWVHTVEMFDMVTPPWSKSLTSLLYSVRNDLVCTLLCFTHILSSLLCPCSSGEGAPVSLC